MVVVLVVVVIVMAFAVITIIAIQGMVNLEMVFVVDEIFIAVIDLMIVMNVVVIAFGCDQNCCDLRNISLMFFVDDLFT